MVGKRRVLVSLLMLLALLVSSVGTFQPSAWAGAGERQKAVAFADKIRLSTIEKPARDAKGWAPPSRIPASATKPAVRLVEWDPKTSSATYVIESVPNDPTGPVFLGYIWGITDISECGKPFENVRKQPGYGGNGEPCYPEGHMASLGITVHQYANLNGEGKANPYGSGTAYVSDPAYSGSRYQQFNVTPCPWPDRGFGGCQNGWGEFFPTTEVWGNVPPPPPADDLNHIRFNGNEFRLSYPLVVRDDTVFMAADPELLALLGINFLVGEKSNYVWFGTLTRTVGVHKTKNGFSIFDLSPGGNTGVFNDSGIYYVDLHRLMFLLGATSINKHNGVWDVVFPQEDPDDRPWVSSCYRHQYDSTTKLLKCPMNAFVMTPYYTSIVRVGDRTASQILRELDSTVGLYGFEPERASGGDWDPSKTTAKEKIATLNLQAAKWQGTDYSHWRYLRTEGNHAMDMYVNAAFAVIMIDEGVRFFDWYLNPARNYALVPYVDDETRAALGKADEALDAAGKQGLGYEYPLVFPTPQTPNAPGRGTYAVIRPYNEAYFTQHKITGLRPPQIIEGITSNSGKSTFMVTIERGAYTGSPWFDGVGQIRNQYYAIEVKAGYGPFVRSAARGEFEEWFENAGRVDSMLKELERQAAAAREMGWKVRWVFTDVRFGIAMRVRATQQFGEDFMKQVEFVYTILRRPMIPPPPPPGMDPYPLPSGPIVPHILREQEVFPVPLTEEAIPKEHVKALLGLSR